MAKLLIHLIGRRLSQLALISRMDEIESCFGDLGAYAAVRQRLEEMVIAQQKAYEQLQQSVSNTCTYLFLYDDGLLKQCSL